MTEAYAPQGTTGLVLKESTIFERSAPGRVGYELPPLEVVQAVAIEGCVIDESDRPAAGMHVSGSRRFRSYGSAVSGEDGHFTLRVPPDVEFEDVLGQLAALVVHLEPDRPLDAVLPEICCLVS